MQKLFENWREFRKETLSEALPFDPRDQMTMPTVNKETGKVKMHNMEMSSEDIDNWLLLAGFADVTGVSGYPAVYNSLKRLIKTPNLINAGWAALAVLGALPMVASAGKLAKVTKEIKKVATEALELAAKIRPTNPKLAAQIEEAAVKASEISVTRELNQWAGGIYHWSQTQANTLLRVASRISGGIWKKAAYRGEALRSLEELAERVGYSTDELSKMIRNSRALDYVKDSVPAGEAFNPVQQKFVRDIGAKSMFDRGKWKYVRLESAQLSPRGRRPGRAGDANWSVDAAGRVTGGGGAESVVQMGKLDWVTADFTNVGQSFSKEIRSARSFIGGKPGYNIRVIYQTSLNNDKIIDIGKVSPKTLRMGESEVMGLGKVRIDGFWIVRTTETASLWKI